MDIIYDRDPGDEHIPKLSINAQSVSFDSEEYKGELLFPELIDPLNNITRKRLRKDADTAIRIIESLAWMKCYATDRATGVAAVTRLLNAVEQRDELQELYDAATSDLDTLLARVDVLEAALRRIKRLGEKYDVLPRSAYEIASAALVRSIAEEKKL